MLMDIRLALLARNKKYFISNIKNRWQMPIELL